MNHDPTRFHTGRFFVLSLAVLLGLFVLAAPGFAQGYGRIISEPDEEETPAIRPYIYMNFGYGDPIDEAYDLAFSKPFFRFGGGFGMTFHDFGAEVILRRGTQEEPQQVASEFGEDFIRNFFISTTELQFRLLGRPHLGKAVFPAGVGVGITTMTVDRGYPGVFDRFSGSGLYVAPFIGMEYPVGDLFSVGFEAEYAISETVFSGSEAWQNQHTPTLNQYRGTYPATEDDFWDTVGGGDGERDFANGGLIVSIRATLFIPTYTED